MRRVLFSATAALALLTAAAPAGAIDVECLNCNTITQSLVAYAQQLNQLAAELQTVQNTLNTYTTLVTNTISLPFTAYRDITGDIAQITSIANQANMLSGQVGGMINNLSARGGYPAAGIGLQNLPGQLAAEANAVANAMRQAANVLNLQPTQLQSTSATLAALQSQAQGASGQKQALQAIAGIGATTGQQLATTQAALTTTMQAMLTYETAQADRQALLDALNRQDLDQGVQAACQALASVGGTSTACSGAAAPMAPLPATTPTAVVPTSAP